MLTHTNFILDSGKSIDSFYSLGLLEQSAHISPAVPQINLVAVPGANGSTDVSDALGTVTYNDRNLELMYALYPEDIDSFQQKCTEVCNQLNGRRVKIVMSEDSDYYYEGRLAVEEYAEDKSLKQIKITAVVKPFKLKLKESIYTFSISSEPVVKKMTNKRMPVLPVIETDVNATISFSGNTFTVNPGRHRLPELCFSDSGVYALTVTAEGQGTMRITYREGSL